MLMMEPFQKKALSSEVSNI